MSHPSSRLHVMYLFENVLGVLNEGKTAPATMLREGEGGDEGTARLFSSGAETVGGSLL